MKPTAFEDMILAPGALRTVFQPIVRPVGGKLAVSALECLTRGPAASPYAQAPALFAEARAQGLEALLDCACMSTAFETARRFAITDDLFVNVFPLTLVRYPAFPARLAATAASCGIAIERITVEVTEHGRDQDREQLHQGVEALRAFGVRVALDDYGLNPDDDWMLRAWRPRWVKVDGHLFRGARPQSATRRIVDAIVSAADTTGVGVIAEGLDQPDDIKIVAELGIELLQGFVICEPLPPAQVSRASSLVRDLATD
jgi:EAL domain-containing protein (putative c-di-GMP-specific phosphodiesterase class I)